MEVALRAALDGRRPLGAQQGLGALLLQQHGGDHDALDLARALVDFGDARVPDMAFRVKLLAVAHATVDLQPLVRDPRRISEA